ncbi:MAG: hypothetical protein MJZ62_06400 [Bacteroidales bacterium]|nr:hypothetical protein [Bacteroidales bacterium]
MESLEVETGLTVLADGLRSRLFWDVGYLVGFDFLGVWFCCGVFLDTNQEKPPLAGLLLEAALHLRHI